MMEQAFIHPFVDPAFAKRLEHGTAWRKVHYAEAYAMLHPGADSSSIEVGGGMAVFVAAHSPVNGVVGMGLDGPVTPADFEVLEAHFTSRGAVPEVTACPLAHHSLFEQLSSRGYGISHFFNVLARVLPEGLSAGQVPPGMQISRAWSEDAMLWLSISARGFEGSDQVPPETREVLGPNFYAPASACYLAWIDDQPAAAGGMYMHEGVVELGGASTLAAFRRRGAQRALIETRLASARALGCDLGMILTEPGSDSQRNAQRASFWLAYTSVVMKKA